MAVLPDVGMLMMVEGDDMGARATLYSVEGSDIGLVTEQEVPFRGDVDDMQTCRVVNRCLKELGLDTDERKTIIHLND